MVAGDGPAGRPERRQEALQVGGILHTLHDALPHGRQTRPELADYTIRGFSRPGETVLDPFCGVGTYVFQANLLGRAAFASDHDPLALRIAAAKLSPVGLDEVVLRLNQIDFRRPVKIGAAWERLEPFYHRDTLREIVNLRSYIAERPDRVNRMIELLVMSRLHGHTSAYVSTYTSPHIALTPERQLLVNRKRRTEPEYRALAPRIIRRAAEVLEDGFSSDFLRSSAKNVLEHSDARRLHWAPADGADLIATAPPLVGEGTILEGDWLARWFAQIETGGPIEPIAGEDAWREMMRTLLPQLLRILKPSRYAVFELPDCETGTGGRVAYDELLLSVLPRIEWRDRRFVADEILSVDQVVGAREKRRLGRSPESAVVRNKLVILRSSERSRWTPRKASRD